jgi:hypothetical protein
MSLFSYLVDNETRNLLVKNKTNIPIRIKQKQCFGYIFEIDNKFVIAAIVFTTIATESLNKDGNLFFDTVKI